MKPVVCVVVLSAIMVGLTGCFISVNEGCKPSKGPVPAPVAVDSTIAEINAVKMLNSDSARLNVLLAIAERPGLSPQARLHLIESVKWLNTDSAREQVLMTLARNADRPQPPQPPVPSQP